MRIKTQKIVTKTTRTVTDHSAVITEDLIRKAFGLPDSAQISVRVPSGADWSGMDLVIGDDIEGINVQWQVVK